MPSILILDSETKVRKALSELYKENNFQVAALTQGVEAAQVMRHEIPDLILVDQDIPMGGIKTAQILRLNARYRQIPIILGIKPCAPDKTRKILQEALSSGIAWVLARPYIPKALIKKTIDCIDQSSKIKSRITQKANSTTDMEVRKQIRSLADLPTLSATQQSIINILSCDDSEVDVDELIEVIQADQALTMRTLKIARSAGYGFQGNLLPSAVTFLGIQKMRQIVQSATIMNIFGDNNEEANLAGLDTEAFWIHSIACGMVMQMISRDNFKSKHYMAGLLHDVGKLVLALKFSPYSQAIDDKSNSEHRPRYMIEQEMLGITHAEIGYEIAHLWNLPNELSECIYHHHVPSQAGRHRMLSGLLHVADLAVRQMNLGHGGDYSDPILNDDFAQKLRLATPLPDVINQRDVLYEQIKSIVTTN